MTSTRVALIGLGKMGRAVRSLAAERECEIVAALGPTDAIDGASLRGAQVAVEFTVPAAAARNVVACAAAGCPVVSGTTGWTDELAAVGERVEAMGGSLVWAANFSVGVNLFAELARRAGELFARGDLFDAHLVETHHAAKLDAPSGTAKVLAAAAARGGARPVPITSVRTGSVPGTHTLIFDSAFEQITLEHAARDRRVFADGALVAARWLAERAARGERGVFSMADVISDRSPP